MEAKGTLFEKQVRVGEQDIGQVGTMQHFIIRLGRASKILTCFVARKWLVCHFNFSRNEEKFGTSVTIATHSHMS